MKKNNMKKIISAAAGMALVLGIATFGMNKETAEERVASIISFDVNPSIELKVNADKEVIQATALNDDAQEVLNGMKLKGTDVTTATNAIVGSLLKHGYIDELANSILLSVEDKDVERGERLQEELTEEVNAILKNTSVNASVLTQYVDDGRDDKSKEYNISSGKAALIEKILAVNNAYQFEELAGLSVNELNLLLSNPKNEGTNVVTTGNASDNAYIGSERAKTIAIEHAGVKTSDVRELEVEFDYERGRMVYEVEFESGTYDYDYSVDAQNGAVLQSDKGYDADNDDDKKAPSNTQSNTTTNTSKDTPKDTTKDTTTDIGREKAKSIAFNHAGVSEGNVKNLEVEREYDDGKLEYHVDFRVEKKEYNYEISGTTGKITDYDVEIEDDYYDDDRKAPSDTTTNTTNVTTDIGREKAKSIAFNHAGVSEGNVRRLEVERDYDDGRLKYDVEFTAGSKEYNYEIDGTTGKIVDYEIDTEDHD